jgi:hypothetical protein
MMSCWNCADSTLSVEAISEGRAPADPLLAGQRWNGFLVVAASHPDPIQWGAKFAEKRVVVLGFTETARHWAILEK